MSEIMVDDYTRRGLFNHLLTHNGRTLCTHEEMSALFDTIQKRQLELSGERQLYCRLYDAGKWTNVTGVLSYSVMHTSLISMYSYRLSKTRRQTAGQGLPMYCWFFATATLHTAAISFTEREIFSAIRRCLGTVTLGRK